MHAITAHWITDRRFDLLCYIAPCLASYLLLYANLALAVPVMFLWWLWVVVIDGPHVFGTISRTYLDAEEWRTRRPLLLGSLLWFLLGPAAVGIGVATGSRSPYQVFLLFASLWAYWHVVRQHYGFLCLYQRKNGEPAGRENALDYWLFYILMIAPLACFVLLNEQARDVVMLSALSRGQLDAAVTLARGAVFAALAVYVGKEWLRWQRGEPLNGPKNLLLLSVVPVHLVVCMYEPVATHLHLLMFSVAVTVHHNVQYHGIVWFYNRNRYRGEGARERFGPMATWVSRSFWVYYAIGLLFTFVVRYSSWIFTGMPEIPGGPGPNFISETRLGGSYSVAELAVAFWWGFAFHHYYLDQRIWRVSRDRQVQSGLRV
ncbi:MAG: hypothetical protein AAF628_27380 [Planctomycetota bacterium]